MSNKIISRNCLCGAPGADRAVFISTSIKEGAKVLGVEYFMGGIFIETLDPDQCDGDNLKDVTFIVASHRHSIQYPDGQYTVYLGSCQERGSTACNCKTYHVFQLLKEELINEHSLYKSRIS